MQLYSNESNAFYRENVLNFGSQSTPATAPDQTISVDTGDQSEAALSDKGHFPPGPILPSHSSRSRQSAASAQHSSSLDKKERDERDACFEDFKTWFQNGKPTLREPFATHVAQYVLKPSLVGWDDVRKWDRYTVREGTHARPKTVRQDTSVVARSPSKPASAKRGSRKTGQRRARRRGKNHSAGEH